MYVDCLSAKDKCLITYHESSSAFCLGDGQHVQSYSMVCLPTYIRNKLVFINTDVVDQDIPLLLSHTSMKKADMQIDFCEESIHAD